MIRLKQVTEILTSLITYIGDNTSLTNFNIGGKIRTVLESVSTTVGELYSYNSVLLKQSIWLTATGVFLEFWAQLLGLERKSEVCTEGHVLFGVDAVKSEAINIPAGSIVRTPTDSLGRVWRYTTQSAVVLEAGELSVAVPVIAEFAGKGYNVGENAICEMGTHIAGIDWVINGADWIDVHGADAERDYQLRERMAFRWSELTTGSTDSAYVSWALSIPGVVSAWVDSDLPRGDGTVDVYILAQDGAPSQALIDTVQTYIETRRPNVADVMVFGPMTVGIILAMLITPRAGFDTDVMLAEIERRVEVFFHEQDPEDDDLIIPIGIGRDIVLAQLYALVMSVDGVYSVSFASPTTDVSVDNDELAELESYSAGLTAPSYEMGV